MPTAFNPHEARGRFYLITKLGLAAVLLLMTASVAQAWPPSNRLPPMGWEPWNFDHCGNMYKWNEAYYKKLADFFVSSGLRDLGYKYLTIECHDHYRDKNGLIQPSPLTFPHGFRVVTNYIHSKGLKVRNYTDAGKGKCPSGRTFQGAGSLGHYADDAMQWKKFGFDGVKIDWCGGRQAKLKPKKQYTHCADAIKKQLPDFYIEICSWGRGHPWKWGRHAGTFWRTGGDIDWWGKGPIIGGTWQGLLSNIDANRHPNPKFVGPGKGWNYPDMLEVGVPGGLNKTEEQTQFGMWAIMAAPLFLGNDVFHMPRYARNIIMNKEVIAVDQDPLGIQGKVVRKSHHGKLQVWSKKLVDGSRAVALLNRDAAPRSIVVKWRKIGLSGKCLVRNLWEHEDKGTFEHRYRTRVQAHGTVLLEISPLHKD